MPAPAATTGTIALSQHIHIEQLCPLCIILPIVTGLPHVVTGPVTSGSQDVFINSKPAARVKDQGVAVPCCNKNTYMIQQGSPTVFINGKPAARVGDMTQHCQIYPGTLIANGSLNVFIGESSSAGMGMGDSAQMQNSEQGGPGGPAPAPAPVDDPPPPPEAPSDPVPASWRLQHADGRPARGFVSRFEAPGRGAPSEIAPDGGGGSQQDGFTPGTGYTVTFVGQKRVKVRFKGADGRPAAGMRVLVARAFGDEQRLVTDGGGGIEVKGLLEEEPVSLSILSGAAEARVRFQGEDGAAVVGLQALLRTDRGDVHAVTTGGDGRLQVGALLPGEGFQLEALTLPRAPARGRFVDEQGIPVAGVQAILYTDSGARIHVVSDAAGRFQTEDLRPREGYRIEVVSLGRMQE